MFKAQLSRLLPVLGFVCVITLWEVAVRLLKIPDYLLPPPSAVWPCLFSEGILSHFLVTTVEAVAGFLIGSAVAFCSAIIFAECNMIKQAFYPWAIALKTTPVIAVAPILIQIFGTGMDSKIAASAMICFFPTLVATVVGLRAFTNAEALLFRSLQASRSKTLTKLKIPRALPYVYSGLKVASSLAVVGAIVGEFIGANKGLGYYIQISYYGFHADRVFAAIIYSAVLGVTLFLCVVLMERMTAGQSHLNDA